MHRWTPPIWSRDMSHIHPPPSRQTDLSAPAHEPAWSILLLAGVLTLVEVLLCLALVRGASAGVVLSGHVLVVAAAAGWWSRSAHRGSRYRALACVATAALGPLGSAGVVVALVSERRHAGRATPPEVWHTTLFPPTPVIGARHRAAIQVSARERRDDVTSFHDILAFGSVEERQAAIAIIAQQYDPSFASALRAAPADEHNFVRVQAATAIARIERQLFERTRALEAALERAPDDADAILALATHNDDQAFAGLFDPAREHACRGAAIDLYERYLRQRPDDASAEFRAARILLRSGRPEAAEPRFRHLADLGHPTARLWLIESLFAQRRWADLRQEAAAWPDRSNLRDLPEARAALELWTASTEAA